MEECVVEEIIDGEGDYDGERCGVDIGWVESEEKVWRIGDIEGCEEGVYGWGVGE